MSNVYEESKLIKEGFEKILDVPPLDLNSEFTKRTSEGIRETIKAIDEFILAGCPGGFPKFNELLSNIVIRYTSNIKMDSEFIVAGELSYTLKGKSGEHFVAGELFRRNTIVALPPQNTPLYDLIVSHPTSLKTVFVQVKTTFFNGTYGVVWQLNDEFLKKTHHKNLFVVLVDARKDPEYFVFEYNALVEIITDVMDLPIKQSRRSGKRIFFSYGDTYHETIRDRFYIGRKSEWDVILDSLV